MPQSLTLDGQAGDGGHPFDMPYHSKSNDLVRGKLSPKQLLLIDWLVEPPGRRNPPTLAKWCKAHQVNQTVASNWKRDALFREAWDRKMHESSVSPDLEQEVLDNLHAIATSQVKDAVPAARLWLSVAQEFRDAAPKADLSASLQEMSDDELEALIARGAAAELAARESAPGGPETPPSNVVALHA